MFAAERRQHVLDYVRMNGAASLRDIAAVVNSSAVTTGTTTHKLAMALTRMRDLSVVTNSILVAQVLASTAVDVVVTGGSLRGATFSPVGGVAEQLLVKVRVSAT